MKAFLGIVGTNASGLMRALALMLCWNWLIVKAWHAQPIGFAMAWTASFVAGVLLIKREDVATEKETDDVLEIMVSFAMALVLYPIAIGIAWIASHFI